MQLITETTHDAKINIVESTEGKKDYYIEGIFMQSDIKNRNGRIYPKPIMERQVKEYNDSYVGRKRALGELGHPENPSVNLERVSHNITILEYKNNTNIEGKAKLMDTPYGNIAKSFVREGIELGVSSRGLGSIKESSGARVVQGDFRLSAIDIVADPSAPSAFVAGIMENKEWIIVDGVLVEQELQDIKDKLDKDCRQGGSKLAENNVFNHLDKILFNANRLNESKVSEADLIDMMIEDVEKAIANGSSMDDIKEIKDKYSKKVAQLGNKS